MFEMWLAMQLLGCVLAAVKSAAVVLGALLGARLALKGVKL